MASISEFTEADLQRFINDGIPESLVLDYKNSKSLKNDSACRNEISKDVSAFANSAGGRIIYGINEYDHLPHSIDEGVPLNGITREWLEQIINNSIFPRVPGIVIRPIVLKSGGTAYVIDVPQSTSLAPHQANDKKYYKRFNFLSEAMVDYEIRDIMQRAKFGNPELWLEWRLPSTAKALNSKYKIAGLIENTNDQAITFARVTYAIDCKIPLENINAPNFTNQKSKVFFENRWADVHLYETNISPLNHMPIWRGTDWTIFRGEISSELNGEYYFGCHVSCPGSLKTLGGFYQIRNGKIILPDENEPIFRDRGITS